MKTKIVLFYNLIFVLSFLVPTNANAKNAFCLGNALSTGSQQAIQEISRPHNDAFRIGDRLELKQLPTISKKGRLIKTVGQIRMKAMIKSCFDYKTYLYTTRGIKQTTGKLFEECYLRAFNRASKLSNNTLAIESTAILGKPHDSADLLVRNKITGEIVDKLQLKLGYQGARDAVTKESDIIKYKDCKILVPKNIYEELVATNKKNILNGSIRTNLKHQKLSDALKSGKIIYTYDGVATKSVAWYKALTQRHIKNVFSKATNRIINTIQKAIDQHISTVVIEGSTISISDEKNATEVIEHLIPKKQVYEIVNNEVKKDTERFLFKTVRLWRIFGKPVDIIFAGTDIVYGGYMIYDANYQYNMGLLDYDLAVYKQSLGITQTTLGIVGVYLIFNPDPVTKVVLVVGLTIVAMDLWIDYIQAQRNATRLQLRNQIANRCKPDAVDRFLRLQIQQPIAL